MYASRDDFDSLGGATRFATPGVDRIVHNDGVELGAGGRDCS